MKNKISILIIACMSSFITPFMGSSINVALPIMGKELSISASLLAWIATSYLLSVSIFLLPSGKIADIYGRRKVFLSGLIIYSFSSFLLSLSSNPYVIIFLRVIQGIGAAMIFGMGIAILTEVFPPYERGKAFGINSASVYTGLSLGPFLGGILTKEFGWRSIFIFNSIFSFITAIYLILSFKMEFKNSEREKFDIKGAVIYGITLLFLIYGLSTLPSKKGIIFFLLGILGIILFVNFEIKNDYPILNINLLRKNLVFSFSNLATFINYASTAGVTFILSLYLQYIKGINPRETGIILLSQPAFMALVSPFAGRISDKIEPAKISSFGMFLTFLSLLIFTFLENNTKILLIILNLILLGLGLGIFASPNTNAVMSSVDKKFYGVSAGMLATMRVLGQMFSMALVTLLLTFYIGGKKIVQENFYLFLKSSKVSFLVFSILCFIGIFVSLKRRKK
ncbi:MAG: MFS transporter [candidate division WOR-3 bacterium]